MIFFFIYCTQEMPNIKSIILHHLQISSDCSIDLAIVRKVFSDREKFQLKNWGSNERCCQLRYRWKAQCHDLIITQENWNSGNEPTSTQMRKIFLVWSVSFKFTASFAWATEVSVLCHHRVYEYCVVSNLTRWWMIGKHLKSFAQDDSVACIAFICSDTYSISRFYVHFLYPLFAVKIQALI